MDEVLPITALIPTIGRSESLKRCLESIVACRPSPDEILVIDQSRSNEVGEVVDCFKDRGATSVSCDGRGIGKGMNVGLDAARNDIVIVTHDDCLVAKDWVYEGFHAMLELPGGIVTGRVLPKGQPELTAGIKIDETPCDYTGKKPGWLLYPANMALDRREALAIGGFDEREGLRAASEDNDFCYRWMDQGRPLRYVPTMIVWHDDQRTASELQRQYRVYARGQGTLYAKHLYAGDLRMLWHIFRDMSTGLRGIIGGLIKGRLRRPDPRRARLIGVPIGFWRGWNEARLLSAHSDSTPPDNATPPNRRTGPKGQGSEIAAEPPGLPGE